MRILWSWWRLQCFMLHNTVFSIWYLSGTQLLHCGSQVLISDCKWFWIWKERKTWASHFSDYMVEMSTSTATFLSLVLGKITSKILGGVFLAFYSLMVSLFLSCFPDFSILILHNSNQFTTPRLQETTERLWLYLYLRWGVWLKPEHS